MKGKVVDVLEKQISDFIEKKRPPAHIRDKVDLSYSYEKYVLEIFEIRPLWDEQASRIKSPIVKTRFIKSRGIWKIFWMRASGKWQRYDPIPEVKSLAEFFKIIDEDAYGCFWG